MFVLGSSFHSRICHSFGDVIIADEGLKILTFSRHSLPLSSEGSLACHTYCDMGLLYIISSPRIRDTHNCCRAFGSGAVTTCFYDQPGIEPRSPACEANALPLHHAAVCNHGIH